MKSLFYGDSDERLICFLDLKNTTLAENESIRSSEYISDQRNDQRNHPHVWRGWLFRHRTTKTAKVYNLLLLNHIAKILKKNQDGFRKKSSSSQILTTHRIIEVVSA